MPEETLIKITSTELLKLLDRLKDREINFGQFQEELTKRGVKKNQPPLPPPPPPQPRPDWSR